MANPSQRPDGSRQTFMVAAFMLSELSGSGAMKFRSGLSASRYGTRSTVSGGAPAAGQDGGQLGESSFHGLLGLLDNVESPFPEISALLKDSQMVPWAAPATVILVNLLLREGKRAEGIDDRQVIIDGPCSVIRMRHGPEPTVPSLAR